MSSTKMSFIVIDDSKLDCVIAQKIIAMATGADKVKTFMFAKEGLDYIATGGDQLPDSEKTVLFVDIQMPVMNGFEFLEAFEQLEENIRNRYLVYVISSSINDSDIARATGFACVLRFISKPLTIGSMNELLEEIRSKLS